MQVANSASRSRPTAPLSARRARVPTFARDGNAPFPGHCQRTSTAQNRTRPGEPRADAVDECVGDREGSRAKRVKHSPALHAAKIHAATL